MANTNNTIPIATINNTNTYRGECTLVVKGDMFKKMMNAKHKDEFRSNTFKMASSNWRINVCPNGYRDDAVGSFVIFLKLMGNPSNGDQLKISRTISTPQFASCYTKIITYKKNQNYGWPDYTLSIKEIKESEYHEIIINIQMTIVRILDESLAPNPFIYQQQIVFNQKQQFEYAVDVDSIKRFKKSYPGKRFESQIFNKIWCLRINPNGWDKSRKDWFDVVLVCCGFPEGINKIRITCQIRCKEMDIKTDRREVFDINKYCAWCWSADKILSFSKFVAMDINAMSFFVDIEIMDIFDNNNKQIDKTKWNEYIQQNINKYEEDEKKEEKEENGPIKDALVISLGIGHYSSSSGFKSLDVGCDIDRYRAVFGRKYGYKVVSNFDGKQDEIQNEIVNAEQVKAYFIAAKKEHLMKDDQYAMYQALIITVSGHGVEGSLVCTNGDRIHYETIQNVFRHGVLGEMPTFYFVDACRDDMGDDTKNDMNADGMEIKDAGNELMIFGAKKGGKVRGGKVGQFLTLAFDIMQKKRKQDENEDYPKFKGIYDKAQRFITSRTSNKQQLTLYPDQDEKAQNLFDLAFATDTARGYDEDEEDDQDMKISYDTAVNKLLLSMDGKYEKYQKDVNSYCYQQLGDMMNVNDVGLDCIVSADDLNKIRLRILTDGMREKGANNADIDRFNAEIAKNNMDYKSLRENVLSEDVAKLNLKWSLFGMIECVISEYEED